MEASMEGKKVPEVTFRTREGDAWRDVTSSEIFAGKKVIVFSLPGAFTPTCSSSHLPRYDELAQVFANEGIDGIVCVSVNDAFVMEAWAREQGVGNVRLLPDGNGEFTKGMGMLVDKADLGFGQRSWRYSMLVDDGVVKKMFVEPELPGDPFEVSDADTMLHHVAPERQIEDIVLFTKPGCPYCARARKALDDRAMPYEEVVLGRDATPRALKAITGQSRVPQIFRDGRHVGGAEELERELSAEAA